MELRRDELCIRSVREGDAEMLCAWWNDGAVMAHAGFPNGLGITPERVREQIRAESDDTVRRFILEIRGVSAGEMSYRHRGDAADIGIKICVPQLREHGYGRRLLTMLLTMLFDEKGYQRVVLDTNLKNRRAQHVYELLGFRRMRIEYGGFIDQLGEKQDVVYYELTREMFRPVEQDSARTAGEENSTQKAHG